VVEHSLPQRHQSFVWPALPHQLLDHTLNIRERGSLALRSEALVENRPQLLGHGYALEFAQPDDFEEIALLVHRGEGAEEEHDHNSEAEDVSAVIVLFRGGLLGRAEETSAYTFAVFLVLALNRGGILEMVACLVLNG
jgi:hypothetical protein